MKRYSLDQVIVANQNQMELFKMRHRKKLSRGLLQDIYSIYSQELGGRPFDLAQRIMIGGHLVLKSVPLSKLQMDAVSACVPFLLNLRYMNLEGIGMEDQQAGQFMLAGQLLKRLVEIRVGKNELREKFNERLECKQY